MNRKISKLIVAFIVILFTSTAAIAQGNPNKTMYIIKQGVVDYKTVVSDIDSITFYDPAVPATQMTSTCYVDRAGRFEGTFNNTVLIDGKLELTGTNTSGTYTSVEFSTVNFTKLVGSWSVSHTNAVNTIEVEYRIRSGSTWSGWLSYRQWGFERVTTNPANGSVDATSGNARISVDEIMPLSGQSTTYNAFQYRATLRRSSGTDISPKIKAIAATLLSSSGLGDSFSAPSAAKTWPITGSNILRQQDVPTIGGSICSATCVTMLMVHKGITFFPGYPTKQEYTAREVVRDPSYGYAGNWSFACSSMGSWGTTDYIAYARHVYSANEIAQLLTQGPIAASINGKTAGALVDTNGTTQYSGSGHLIVVRGFEMSGNTVSAFLISDPNNAEGNPSPHDYKVTSANLLRCMVSKIAYVLE